MAILLLLQCLTTDTDGMMKMLTIPDSGCDAAIASTTITTTRQEMGIEVSAFAYGDRVFIFTFFLP